MHMFWIAECCTKKLSKKVKSFFCRTRFVGKGGLWGTSFIYKYGTSTTYPLYETMQCFILIDK